MLHRTILQLLMRTRQNNELLYTIILFLIFYITTGIACGILYLITLYLKERNILTKQIPIKDRIIFFILIIIQWPTGITNLYELFYNFLLFFYNFVIGNTFRGDLMSDDRVIRFSHIVYDNNNNLLYRKFATEIAGCVEETITEDGDNKGNLYCTIHGIDKEAISQIIPPDISFCSTTILEFIYTMRNNGIPGIQRVKEYGDIKLQFEDNNELEDITLVIPQEVLLFSFTSLGSVYIIKAPDFGISDRYTIDGEEIFNIEKQMIHEIHTNDKFDLLMIDYDNNEAYVLDKDRNEIMNCEFNIKDHNFYFTKVKIGDIVLNYKYDDLDTVINVEAINNKSEYGYFIRIDESDDINITKLKHVTVTYPVPFVIDIGNVYIYSDNCRIYRTDDINIDNGKIVEMKSDYRLFNDEEEKELHRAFSLAADNIFI